MNGANRDNDEIGRAVRHDSIRWGGDMKKWYVVVAIVLLSGCGESDTSGPPPVTVHPGESIQAAIDAAPPNATIFVEPGVYHESGAPSAIVISKDGIQLVGVAAAGQSVVLENSGNQQNGIVVAPPDSVSISEVQPPGEHPPCGENGNLIHGFALQGFTVRGFTQFGVYLACVDGFTLAQNFTDADQLYGLFPVRSHNGTMSDNEAQHTSLDAALYVGQSDHVTISGNRSHDNLLGMEIENSSDITATNNQAFNNTLGLIADVMPGLQKHDQTNVKIVTNDIHDNNLPNSADLGEQGMTPPGTGMVILGGSMVTVEGNHVSNNGFAGIIVASYCTGVPSCANIDIDPNPEQVQIRNNDVSGNGSTPPTDPLEASLAADLIWDNQGTGNCWSGNTAAATVKVLGGRQLPACQ
jgi:parallel beta-helix repeat protein